MSRRYLTVTEYSLTHDIPRSTLKDWIREGKLEANRTVRPMLIPDDQPVPKKDPAIHKWRYQFREDGDR